MSAPFFVPVLGPQVVEYTLWGMDVMGVGAIDAEPTAYVVLGTKFRANANGNIAGIRWQRVPGGAGALEIALFSGSTNISGTSTVVGQTSSGWQRQDFSSPVAITANTIYTACARYALSMDSSPTSYYAANEYFATTLTNGPLEAVANSISPNGVYEWSATMIAPTNVWQNECYFVDVIYTG